MRSAFVYILQFNSNGKYYIGSTTDIVRRLRDHRNGNTRTTKLLGDFKLVFQQEVDSLSIARWAERKIKRWKRKDFIEKIIKEGRLKFLESLVG